MEVNMDKYGCISDIQINASISTYSFIEFNMHLKKYVGIERIA